MAFETADEVVAGLRRHFLSSDDYDEFGCYGEIFTTELTMPDTRRRADAVYLNLMESRGLAVDIVEVKVSHADFKSELANSAKAEDFFRYSSRFWIAAPNEQVAPPEMIPDGWGLLLPPKRSNGKTWQVAVQPAVREPDIDMKFMRMITNRIRDVGMQTWSRDNKRHERAMNNARQKFLKEIAEEGAQLTSSQRSAISRLQSLENQLGMTVVSWPGRIHDPKTTVSVGELADAYLSIGRFPNKARPVMRSSYMDMMRMQENLGDALDDMRKVMDELGIDMPGQ